MKKRYYITMTWMQWPARGSHTTIVLADNTDEAEELCLAEMANKMGDAEEDEGEAGDAGDDREWLVVDCFDIDKFICPTFRAISKTGCGCLRR